MLQQLIDRGLEQRVETQRRQQQVLVGLTRSPFRRRNELIEELRKANVDQRIPWIDRHRLVELCIGAFPEVPRVGFYASGPVQQHRFTQRRNPAVSIDSLREARELEHPLFVASDRCRQTRRRLFLEYADDRHVEHEVQPHDPTRTDRYRDSAPRQTNLLGQIALTVPVSRKKRGCACTDDQAQRKAIEDEVDDRVRAYGEQRDREPQVAESFVARRHSNQQQRPVHHDPDEQQQQEQQWYAALDEKLDIVVVHEQAGRVLFERRSKARVQATENRTRRYPADAGRASRAQLESTPAERIRRRRIPNLWARRRSSRSL